MPKEEEPIVEKPISVPISRSSTLKSCTIVSSGGGTIQEDDDNVEDDDFEEDSEEDMEEDMDEDMEEDAEENMGEDDDLKTENDLETEVIDDDNDVIGKKLSLQQSIENVDTNILSPESEPSLRIETCADDDSIT